MMNTTEILVYCLSLKAAQETFPFGPDVRVLKVMGKMFALIPVEDEQSISLKCDPGWSQLLREHYAAVQPGYHLNKRHWNTVTLDGTVPDDELREMVRHSYDLVAKGLKKADREKLAQLDE